MTTKAAEVELIMLSPSVLLFLPHPFQQSTQNSDRDGKKEVQRLEKGKEDQKNHM